MSEEATPAQAKERSARRLLTTLAKFAISIALLAGIAWKVPLAKAWSSLQSLSWVAVVAIVLLTFAFPAIAALRWKRALARLQAPQAWWPLFADTLVSSTYNMLLPTNIGGDVVRAIRCARRIDHGHQAWSSMIFERLVGIVALALLALPGVAMAPGRARDVALAVGSVAVVSIVLVFFAHTPFRVAARMLARRAPSVAGAGDQIAHDLSVPLASIPARLEMMGWSFLYQVVGLGILVVVVWDWGAAQSAWAIFAAVPLALVLTLLPVSIAGLGVRESLFVVLLGRFGVSSERSLALALVWLASSLLLAFAGAAVMAYEAISSAPSQGSQP